MQLIPNFLFVQKQNKGFGFDFEQLILHKNYITRKFT